MITTNLNYPKGLPAPLKEGHTTNHVQPFRNTRMVSGRTRNRRGFTSVPSVGTYNFLFTDVQAAAFEAWFRDTINDGADYFNIRRRTPLGISTLVCKFVSMYRGPNLVGVKHWQISAEIEAWERPLLPVGWGNFPGQILGSSIIDYATNREWPES